MSTPLKVDTARVKDYFLTLQESIVSGLEALDGTPFQIDRWTREQGGGGVSRLLENGQVFERAGVLFSHVMGDTLPASATSHRPAVAGRRWEAMGVSLVLHPDNPFVPTTHMNVRMFVAYAPPDSEDHDIFWFGGGMDLTPYYVFEEDAKHFHQSCCDALNAHDPELYPAYKAWCDDYFYLKHRQETRGVGGVFFDDLNEPGFEESFAITRSVGDAFLGAYQPIVEKRHHLPFKPSHKDFQHYRRGRYVEFNLVFDRGTLFGLQSGGRTESILMSMPPVVNWRYDWHPAPGSEEAKLYEYLTPKDWLACE